MRIPAAARRKAKKIKLLLLDVDGVLTDGAIVIDNRGIESKYFDVRDGQGLALLQHAGIEVGLITGRRSNVVRHRARELGVKMVYQGVRNKADIYNQIKRKTGLLDDQIAYAGDDLPDLAIFRRVGFAIAVPVSGTEIRDVVHYVTQAQGGHGAVREIAELLLKAQGLWQSAVHLYL